LFLTEQHHLYLRLKGYIFLLMSCFFLAYPSVSQNQQSIDSLEHIYASTHLDINDRLALLKELSEEHPDISERIGYSNELIELATTAGRGEFIIAGYLQQGAALRLRGDLMEALNAFIKSAETAIRHNLQRDLGLSHIAAADIYSIMDNHEDAVHYYHRGIKILREENDSLGLASALLNAGDEYFNYEELDSALVYFEESGELFEHIDYEVGKAYNLGNIGLVYAKKGETGKAETNINEAISILDRLEDYYPICVYLTYISDIYRDKGNNQLALKFAKESYQLALRYGLKQEISDASLKLYKLYDAAGDVDQGFYYYRQHIVYRDSVNNISEVQETARLRADFEIAQKQLEVDLLTERQENQRISMIASIVAAISVALLALGLFMRYRFIYKTNQIIQAEKARSDELLLNILPEETAKELKEFGKVQAKRFDSVTVMFTDFRSFTSYAENISPEQLVESVDYYFSKFDEIMDRYDLEKIKTVGDAYLCAGGLPYPTKDHAIKMIHAAKDILAVMEQAKNDEKSIVSFDIRIGIHTGPVVAGVVGSKKFAYDIWGDTVNVASRMESNAETNHINISKTTYDLVKDKFSCLYRGDIAIKNRSNIEMYYVEG